MPPFFSCFISAINAFGSAILIPIPIAAVLGFFGMIAISLLADPIVNLSSGRGNAMIFGEKDLRATIFDLGTAVYRRSTPDLRAAIEVSRGAP